MSSPSARLWPYIQRHRRDVLRGLGCAIGATAVSLVSPWILKYAVDDLAQGVTAGKLRLYAALLLAVALVGGIFRFLMRRIVIGVSRVIEYDLRNDFFAHFERWAMADFQRHRTGDLMSRATNDLSAVRMMVGPAVMYAASTVFLFVVALALMFSLSVKLTLIALIPLPFVSLAVKYFGDAIHRRFEQIQEQLADISAIVQEALAGVRVVRAYRQEPHELRRFREANDEYVARNRRLVQLQGLLYPSLTFFLGIASLLVLWVGSREVIAGRLSIGEFVAFMTYLTMLSWPMMAFGWVTNLLQRGTASWKRMLDLLDVTPTITDQVGEPLESNVILRGAIAFDRLTFAYDTEPVLADISFRVDPGQTVAVVGPTGSGKSTLLQLVARLHDPPPGTVFVDEIDVRRLPLLTLRRAIGFVPQEPFLFSDTLAANIAFSASGPPSLGSAELRRDGPTDRIRWAASVARLDADVAQFPRGYDSMVGERGITLSGGQKQRTALARALMVDPRILILDDALSAVDTYTEEEILQRLRDVRRQRTALVVSHRVSTVRDADLILVLDRGRIIERGTHTDLVAHGGAYAELYRKQLLEEELAAS
ncbi:MAG: ATP-binding cassette domain-containing protein [Luteitalea sp.]|nr:ATP-binding cassette domain-containing protein [Luteitalea sp.]